jgi:hypothetical protein
MAITHPCISLSRLRTLEFWVDNLNPEFLFPEISKQSDLFVSLMQALSTHLRPAPYPYGLLTLRLLGKLGGKNRRVLRELMDIKDPASFNDYADQLKIECRWFDPEESDVEAMETSDDGLKSGKTSNDFSLPLSIERCVEIIKRLVDLCPVERNGEQNTKTAEGAPLLWEDNERLWDIRIEETDLFPYCSDVLSSTQTAQAESALDVLRTALNEMISVEAIDLRLVDVSGESSTRDEVTATEAVAGDFQSTPSSLRAFDNDFELVGLGLMLGCTLESVREKSLDFTKGFLSNMFIIVISHQQCFVRIDANGSAIGTSEEIPPGETESDDVVGTSGDIFSGSLGSKPFGYFEQTGRLKNVTNPLVVNKSLAEMLSQVSTRSQDVGLQLLQYILGLPESLDIARSDDTDARSPEELNRGSLIFFESLLSALCKKCITSKWNRREGLYMGIVQLLQKMGRKWSRKYEVEVMNVALFSLKSVPKEMSMVSVKTFGFVAQVCTALYGSIKMSEDDIIVDVLTSKAGSKEDPAKIEALVQGKDPPVSAEVQSEDPSVSGEAQDEDPPLSTEGRSEDPPVSAEGQSEDPSVSGEAQEEDPPLSTEGRSEDPPVSAEGGSEDPFVSAEGQGEDPPVSAEGQSEDPSVSAEGQGEGPPAGAEVKEAPGSSGGELGALFCPCEDVLQVLITEMASTKHILR